MLSFRLRARACLPAISLSLAMALLAVPAASAAARQACPGVKLAKVDTDRDRILNFRDKDIDGDRRANKRDKNVDGDRRANKRDRDVDGDRVPNGRDLDIDSDGIRNAKDLDMDGDGVKNLRDADVDGDGVTNAKDSDANADCVSDRAALGLPAAGAPSAGDAGESSSAPAAAPLPASFFGIVADKVMASEPDAQPAVLQSIRDTGTGTLRQAFRWREIEIRPDEYWFNAYDNYVLKATRAGFTIMPVLFDPPAWRGEGADSGSGAKLPRNAEFAEFAADLVERYGPSGTFWAAHPDLEARPIRSWQVWNEPNTDDYWPGGGNAKAYTDMLCAVNDRVKAVDAGAEVVTAGLPESGQGIAPFVRGMHASGADRCYDTLAVHAYASTPSGAVGIVSAARDQLDSYGLRGRDLRVTEMGWATQSASAFTVNEETQARYLADTYSAFAAMSNSLHLTGVVHFGWQDARPWEGGRDFWGLHTGFFRIDGGAKKSLSSYSSTLAALQA